MRSKNPETKVLIEQAVDNLFDENRKIPSLREIANEVGISHQTIKRYLYEMADEGTLEYDGQRIITEHIDELQKQRVARLPLIGSIPCGNPESEEQQNGEYIEVPVSCVGKGSYYVLIADGDSMINAGINNGDMVIVRKTASADYGRIIVALDEDNQSTLKRYMYDKKKGRPYLHPENSKYDDIYTDEIKIQGVAEKVIKDLI